MATIEQIDDLYRFAKEMPADVRGELSIEQILEQWKSLNAEDIAAIRESLDDFDRGERGRSAAEFFADVRAQQVSKGT